MSVFVFHFHFTALLGKMRNKELAGWMIKLLFWIRLLFTSQLFHIMKQNVILWFASHLLFTTNCFLKEWLSMICLLFFLVRKVCTNSCQTWVNFGGIYVSSRSVMKRKWSINWLNTQALLAFLLVGYQGDIRQLRWQWFLHARVFHTRSKSHFQNSS